MNRQLLKDAIADAKTVKESAIANAKLALEESLTPHLQSILTTKIREMEEEDDLELEEKDIFGEEEILTEEDEKEEEEEEVDEAKKDDESDDEEAEAEEETDEENIELDDMTDDQLKKFIESVITGMVDAGELVPGESFEGDLDDDEELGFDIEDDEMIPVEDEAEELEETIPMEEVETLRNDLRESVKTIKSLKKTLNEINLLNSKLLYTNKIFKSKNLTENEKVKVLSAFDKATTIREAKLVYESLNVSSKSIKPKIQVKENIRASASKVIGETKISQKPILEIDPLFERFQKLAGL